MNIRKFIRRKVSNIMMEGISDDTPIFTDIVAENVFYKYLNDGLVEYEDKDYIINRLSEIAESIYESSYSFRKKINAQGNKGRNMLWNFMGHWLDGYIKTNRWIDE